MSIEAFEQKSKGQIAYEADLENRPVYDNGVPRASWAELDEIAQWSWERDPTPRTHLVWRQWIEGRVRS